MSVSESFEKGTKLNFDDNLRVNSIRFDGTGESNLDYFEDVTLNTEVFPVSAGPWASPINVDIKYTRIGNSVTCSYPNLFQTGNNQSGYIAFQIPERFRAPGFEEHKFVSVLNNGSNDDYGLVTIDSFVDGRLGFFVNLIGQNFGATTNSVGVYGSTFKWHL